MSFLRRAFTWELVGKHYSFLGKIYKTNYLVMLSKNSKKSKLIHLWSNLTLLT